MRVALVQPWHLSERWAVFAYLPAYGLLRLGGIFPETKIFNGAVLGRDVVLGHVEDGRFDVVGVTAQTALRHPAREILAVARQTGARTVVGGHHATAMPGFFAGYADHVVRGHGEQWWSTILAGDEVPAVTPLVYDDHPDFWPVADWTQVVPDPLAQRSYHPESTPLHVATSYGCSGNCLYCISRLMHGGEIKRRTRRNIEAEIAPLYQRGARRFYLIDECFGGDFDHALSICDLIRIRFPGLRWSTFGRVDYLTEELVNVMAQSGCVALIIGFESADQEMLRRIGKGYIDVGRFSEVVKWCRSAGMTISAQTMVGLPYETVDHERLTTAFLESESLPRETLGHTIVMPGMPLYDLCVQGGLLDESFWEGPDLYYRYRGGLTWEGE